VLLGTDLGRLGRCQLVTSHMSQPLASTSSPSEVGAFAKAHRDGVTGAIVMIMEEDPIFFVIHVIERTARSLRLFLTLEMQRPELLLYRHDSHPAVC
jgi:hypothetical protein